MDRRIQDPSFLRDYWRGLTNQGYSRSSWSKSWWRNVGLLARCTRQSLLQILRSPGKQSHCGTHPQAASLLLDLPVRYSPGPRTHRFTGGSWFRPSGDESNFKIRLASLAWSCCTRGRNFWFLWCWSNQLCSPELGALKQHYHRKPYRDWQLVPCCWNPLKSWHGAWTWLEPGKKYIITGGD